METLANLRRKLSAAKDIKSVVRAMKAMAASNITQYTTAVSSLGDYYQTISLAIAAYLIQEKIHGRDKLENLQKNDDSSIRAIIFGSDQGLVGRFNNLITDFVRQTLDGMPGKKEIWVIGERAQALLSDSGLIAEKTFAVPNSIEAVTPLIGKILIEIEKVLAKNPGQIFYIFHNKPKEGAGYEQVVQRLLPLDEKWQNEFSEIPWPAKNIPQIVGKPKPALLAFISGYLFVSLFKACAESLASENASRLEAMQRADKNIGDLLDSLNHKFHRLRQSSIDEELFDVVSGFEALKVKVK